MACAWKTGQGATEYLVLLAVVLIVAMAGVALLGGALQGLDEQRLAQSRAYWSSASPIAIVEASATETAHIGDNNGMLLTLQNNGGDRLQLIAISDTGNMDGSECWKIGLDLGEQTTICNNFVAPYSYLDNYETYIAPPRGTGHATYSQQNYLSPGETITVGIEIVNRVGGAGYPKRVCRNADYVLGKYMELETVAIYYATEINGLRIIKKQQGEAPLIMPCTNSMVLS